MKNGTWKKRISVYSKWRSYRISCNFPISQLLPVPMHQSDYNIWNVLKNSIGKELSKITMPVVFNEPLSFLQRMAEYMEYAHLLDVASQEEDPIKRFRYVIGFAVSALASNLERIGKPFNPLLGETYELEREDFRIICEQVSHHPPISAFYAESTNWVFHGSIHPKLKFWGKSVEIQPKGMVTLEFPKLNEAYTWTNVTCCVHNLIMGKLWMEQCGTMEIVTHSPLGYKTNLHFKQAGGSSKDLHCVEGYILDKSKQKVLYIYGKWTEFIKCCDYTSYEDFMKENANKLKAGDKPKGSPSGSPSHTSKKMLQKFNSLKVSSFRSQNSSREVDETTDSEELPKNDNSSLMDIPNSSVIWEVTPKPPQCGDYYHFTQFAMSLNQLEDGMDKKLCPTDSRLRPDIRKLEEGDIDGAAAEKTRLEEKQRDANKHRKNKSSVQWTPRWFKPEINPYSNQEDWSYNGHYWDRDYSEVPDIF